MTTKRIPNEALVMARLTARFRRPPPPVKLVRDRLAAARAAIDALAIAVDEIVDSMPSQRRRRAPLPAAAPKKSGMEGKSR